MTKLRVLFVTLITIIGVTHSQNVDFEGLSNATEDSNPEYRSYNLNDTSEAGISLRGMGISSLNSMFQTNIPNLKWLVLDENQIEIISSNAFKFFPELTYLSLARNGIGQVDYGAFNHLKKLEGLNLDGNPYFQNILYPDRVEGLTSLKRLYLRDCQLTSFVLPTLISHLSHLHLNRNQLPLFYTSSESSLTHLYLNDNQLRYVSLSMLKTLTHVNASNNQFTRLARRSDIPPDHYARNFNEGRYRPRNDDYDEYEYGSHPVDHSGFYLDDAAASLQYLIISSNGLLKIDPNTFLDSKALVHVDLTHNEINKLDADTFNELPQLEIILLDHNQIKRINHRSFINLRNLKTISLQYNKIDELNENAFTGLNSSANEVSLFLDNNQIRTLKRGAFKDVRGLKYIGLSHNRIKTILSQVFVNLPNLVSIVIEDQLPVHNFFSHNDTQTFKPSMRKGLIESDAFFNLTNLISIKIRGNLFTDIEPQAFHNLPKLQSLDLSNNKIANLSAETFSDLPVLENLYLGENLISKIAPHTFPQSIKHLDLASNLICPQFSCWHVEELLYLEELNLSNMFERFTINDFADLPKNVTVIMSTGKKTP